MASIPSVKNPAQMLREFRDKQISRTAINNFERQGKARAFSDAVVDEMISLNQKQRKAFQGNHISTAKGENLRQLGLTHGVAGRPSNFARVRAEELSLALYVETGTFGDINGGNPITIPENTIIYSQPNNNELGATVRYRLDNDYTLLASSTIVYVGAIAETSGTTHNVGKGVLRNHEFASYTDFANSTLKVVNFFPILNGADTENEDQHRYRLSQNYNRLMTNSDTRILLTSLRVPGVVDIRTVPGYFGIGTVGAIVLGAENQANSALISDVQAKLNRFNGPGGMMRAVAAVQVVFDLELEVRTSRSLTSAEQSRLNIDINRACANYFRSQGIGGQVIFDDLAREIQLNTRGLVRLGTPGNERRLIKTIYARTGFSNGTLSEKDLLIGSSLSLEEDEYADLGILEVTYV